MRTERRYYHVGEKVYVKELKTVGEVKALNIQPEKGIYKATVETTQKLGEATIIRTADYDVWDIDKNKVTYYKNKRKTEAKVKREKLRAEQQKHTEKKEKLPTILFSKVHEDAKIPSKDEENAGYDVYACFDKEELVVNVGETVLVPTGIASSVLSDYVLVAKERGSTGTKGMRVGAGVIDSGYRGEIFIALNNTSDKKIVISKALDPVVEENTIVYPYEKAIAQLLLLPVPKANVKEIPYERLSLIPSRRGTGVLGSSGK